MSTPSGRHEHDPDVQESTPTDQIAAERVGGTDPARRQAEGEERVGADVLQKRADDQHRG